MQILVDADACPVVGIVESLAEKYNMEFTLSPNQILWFGIIFMKESA